MDDFYEQVSDVFWENKDHRNTFRFLKFLAPKSSDEQVKELYVTLRYIDDLADLTHGADKETRIMAIEEAKKLFLGEVTSYRSFKDIEEREPSGRDLLDEFAGLFGRILRESNPDTEAYLRNGFLDLTTVMIEDVQSEGVYSWADGKVTVEKGADLKTPSELLEYIKRIQHYPTIMHFKHIGESPKDSLVEDMSYALMLVKQVRGKELAEDVEMGRVYISDKEMEDSGLSEEDFVNIVMNKEQDPRMAELVRNRLEWAYGFTKKAVDCLKEEELPNWIEGYLLTYGHIVKYWVDRLTENEYQPFREGDVWGTSPGKLDLLRILSKTKGKWEILRNMVGIVGEPKQREYTAADYETVLDWGEIGRYSSP